MFKVKFKDGNDGNDANDANATTDGADLLDATQFESFKKFIAKSLDKQIELKRVYSASKDGFMASAFHSKTDNIDKRVIIIKNDLGTIFGGYVSKSFNSITVGKWLDDPNAFIYQFHPKQQVFRTKEANGITYMYIHN